MKKSLLLIPVILFGVLFFLTYSCEKDPEEVCESFDPECGAPEPATVCCTDNICYFTYQGKRYDCEDEDCEDGQAELIEDMCGVAVAIDVKAIKTKLHALTMQLLQEARSSSKSKRRER